MKILILRKKTLLLASLLLLLLALALLLWPQVSAAPTLAHVPEEAVPLPVIMYHSVLQDSSQLGPYVISPATFEDDLRYLQAQGYTSILIADLIAYTTQGQPLPEKPVLLTFDDGNLNNLTYILPLLQQYGARAVVSVVGEYVEQATAAGDHNPAYSYLTWEEIRQLAASGLVEIGNHTYALHHNEGGRQGALPLASESAEEYQALLAADLQQLQEALAAHCGLRPTVFAYPFGFIAEASLEVVQELGFQASLSCYEGLNHITRDPGSLYCLKRYNRPGGISTEQFMQRVLSD